MHHFSKKLFDKALLENRLELILKECVRPVDIGASIIFSRFLTEMFNHMHSLLSDAVTPPFLKNRTIEVRLYAKKVSGVPGASQPRGYPLITGKEIIAAVEAGVYGRRQSAPRAKGKQDVCGLQQTALAGCLARGSRRRVLPTLH